MAEKLEIYKCEACGNIIEVLHGGGGELVCCGEPMKRLVENPAYAAKKGINGERYIKSFHSFRAVGVRYRRRLEQLKLI